MFASHAPLVHAVLNRRCSIDSIGGGFYLLHSIGHGDQRFDQYSMCSTVDPARVSESQEMFHQMEGQKVEPDEICFNEIIRIHVKQSAPEKAKNAPW